MASSLPRVLICASFLVLLVVAGRVAAAEGGGGSGSGDAVHVLTLDFSNFSEVVGKHQFIVVEFYAPWCGHCKKLEPEFEKAAAALSKHDPPIVLAKVDANEESNKELASKFDVRGYPTIKILRNEGKNSQEYKGPRDADGIVQYIKKQAGPASAEIKSAEDAARIMDEKKIFVVGVFSKFSGEEFDNFIAVAEKLRSDYEFGHTLDANFLQKGEANVDRPFVRLLKPFDERFVDSQEFHVDNLEKFIADASIPLVTIFDKDPSNRPFIQKFFNNVNVKAMLFLNFSSENAEEFTSKYHVVAGNFKSKNISFLQGDLDASKSAFQFFGLKEEHVPLIIVQSTDGEKYLKTHLQPGQIAPWLEEYMEGSLKPYKKSEPIPEANSEPVKVVVLDNIHDMVFNSGKNVLLEFYAPWCGHCKKLAPVLDEVATSFESDPTVVIAKMDATANDVPKEFNVQGFPTLYFSSASGKLVHYDGGRTKEDFIDFIQKNKDTTAQTDALKDEL